LGIGEQLNLFELICGDRTVMGKVESQSICINRGALLFHLRAQNLTKGPMQ
jgi:hypothetical protein